MIDEPHPDRTIGRRATSFYLRKAGIPLDAGDHQRPWVDTGGLLGSPVVRDEVGEGALRPVVDVAGRVPEAADVPAGEEVRDPPARLVRDAKEERVTCDAAHLGKRMPRAREMLENLHAADEVEAAVGERQVVR